MNLPDFLIPWKDRFYEPMEMDLLLILASQPREKEQIRIFLEKNKTLDAITMEQIGTSVFEKQFHSLILSSAFIRQSHSAGIQGNLNYDCLPKACQ